MEQYTLIQLRIDAQAVVNLHSLEHGLECIECRGKQAVFMVRKTDVSDLLFRNVKENSARPGASLRQAGAIRNGILQHLEQSKEGYRLTFELK